MKIQRQKSRILLVLLIILLFVLTIASATYANEYFNSRSDTDYVLALGLINKIDINESDSINVVIKGSASPKHTIVPIANIGVQDFNVYVDYMTQALQSNNRLALIDRLGSGFSDDTLSDRTISNIVNEYRQALQLSGVEGPYILLTHQIGAIYATYWQSTFPNEIEGIIYIDPVLMMEGSSPNIEIPSYAYALSIGGKIGLQRWFYNYFHDAESVRIQAKYVKAAKAFNSHSTYTFGYISEVENLKSNYDETISSIKTTDIPKMYINSTYGFETENDVTEFMDYVNERAKLSGKDAVYNDYKGLELTSKIQDIITESENITNVYIKSIAQKLGNCYLVQMPGYNEIYEQMPETVKTAITGFINYLDGVDTSIYERYIDSVEQSWKNQAKTSNPS